MFIKFLRENTVASAILAVLRIYIGWQWLTSGWDKVFGPEGFDASGYLQGVVGNEEVMEQYPTYHAFIENVALPNSDLFSFIVAWGGEIFVGLGLIAGMLGHPPFLYGVYS
ncbi:DoxX family protein [Salisediminibacterium halotolerans]|uniref:DoxX family protein n=2 Tax=Salisediminibacterium halotolerans TaxID=517425 RepID=UPI000EAFB114|nr:thiosulfate dehydrogenase [quinone] large subunit [Actinophytocola xinjiangensis]RPE87506.1 DoxX-like protein [Salisediminibacterium halotolerans]TWG35238.1 thiosulfate dehydrogenase [quinone] large subunit [Salisediminibacterium halotolerans]